MAFKIKKMDLAALDNDSGEFTYKNGDSDIKITVKSFHQPQFQRALNLIQTREQAILDSGNDLPMGEDWLASQGLDSMRPEELILRAAAQYLIVDWDVTDEDDNPLPINGDNFMLLVANVEDPVDFIPWFYEKTGDVARATSEALADTKKKPSNATDGRKNTKASPSSKKQSESTSASKK